MALEKSLKIWPRKSSKGKEINIIKKKNKTTTLWFFRVWLIILHVWDQTFWKLKNPKKEFPLQEMYLTLGRYITTASGWYVDHNLTKWMGDRLQLCIEKLLLRNLLFMGYIIFQSVVEKDDRDTASRKVGLGDWCMLIQSRRCQYWSD